MTPMNGHKKGRGRPPLPGKRRLAEAMSGIDLYRYLSYRDFLQAVYNAIKEKEKYSYLQFAEDLGYPRTNTMWMVTTGRRNLNKGSVARVAKALGLTDARRTYFEKLIEYGNATNTDTREAIFAKIVELKGSSVDEEKSRKMIRYYSQWYHSVVRELVGWKDFDPDPVWVSQQLNVKIKPQEIEGSIVLLEELGLIAYDKKKKRYVQTTAQIMPEKNIQTMAVIRYHQRMCDIARDSLMAVRPRRLEYNSITVSISEETSRKAREILREACQKIMDLEAECKDQDQVYHFNVHMFPFTKNNQ